MILAALVSYGVALNVASPMQQRNGALPSGTFRTQVKGEPEMIYKAGASFYDTPNGIHLISANASTTEPATLVAYLICDHDAPLSLDVVEPTKQKETAQ